MSVIPRGMVAFFPGQLSALGESGSVQHGFMELDLYVVCLCLSVCACCCVPTSVSPVWCDGICLLLFVVVVCARACVCVGRLGSVACARVSHSSAIR